MIVRQQRWGQSNFSLFIQPLSFDAHGFACEPMTQLLGKAGGLTILDVSLAVRPQLIDHWLIDQLGKVRQQLV